MKIIAKQRDHNFSFAKKKKKILRIIWQYKLSEYMRLICATSKVPSVTSKICHDFYFFLWETCLIFLAMKYSNSDSTLHFIIGKLEGRASFYFIRVMTKNK